MSSTLRILHLEDIRNDAELVRATLDEEGVACEIVLVDTRADFLRALEGGRFDLILPDYKLPSFDSLAALAIAQEKCPDVPFITVSGTIGEERAIETLKSGATDYVLKHRLSRLAPSVRRALHEARERTERRRAEEALRKSEERLKRIVEHLPEGVCLLDGNMRVTLANPLGREHLRTLTSSGEGETLSGLGGHAIEDLLTPRPDGLPHEVTPVGSSGRTFTVEARPVVEETAEGGWVLLVKDVTHEREMLERVQRQDRLASVGQMAAGIAHDFNNMLTVMMGFAQMLEMEPEVPEKIKEDLNRIFSQGQRAAQLIRQILDFSRKSVVERQPVDLVAFLKEIMKLLERTLPESIRVAVRFDRGNYLVEASLTQLQQVMTNLAVNARDALPEGGELRVRLSNLLVASGQKPPLPEMGPGDWVVWTVSDTGMGMPPEVLAHIYEPFFTTKASGLGTGLGMAQVYGIVQQHGGYIDVWSEVNRGTTFTIYLPLLQITEASVKQAEVTPQMGHGETILLVEDQADVLGIVRAMLERLSYRVLTAANGQEAQEVFGRRRAEIALVLTDMVMPGMSGMELCQALRRQDPGAKIVAMTGYPLKEGGAMPQGIAGWIDKPVTLMRMAQAVRNALDEPVR